MTKFFRDFLRDETGASAAEYALILAVVGAGIAGAAYTLGTSIDSSITEAQKMVDNCKVGSTTIATACK